MGSTRRNTQGRKREQSDVLRRTGYKAGDSRTIMRRRKQDRDKVEDVYRKELKKKMGENTSGGGGGRGETGTTKLRVIARKKVC